MPQGGTVPLTYNGATYNFIANYYGGNGRSLVLQWPCTGLAAWGDNYYGELGNSGSSTYTSIPVLTATCGALTGKTLIAIATGNAHTLALTTDGGVYAWGYNYYGQLGNSGTTNSAVPVAVNTSGPLAGKTVVAIAAGGNHSLALTSDGQLYAWGYNYAGQLGNGSTVSSSVPVAVNVSGALAGKTVIMLAAGDSHSMALTSDGRVFTWGYNADGELGNYSTLNSSAPVAVYTSGVLSGKAVIGITAGSTHSLAMTSDGKVFSWGSNGTGELGNSGTTNSSVPVAVSTSGALAGKTIVAIAAGSSHNLALSADGKVFGWGYNYYGQLGNNSTNNSSVPVPVSTSGAMTGKRIGAITAGGSHSLAITTDNLIFGWGSNGSGELGNNTTTDSWVPVPVTSSGVLAGKTVVSIAAGSSHSLAMFSFGPPIVSIPSNIIVNAASRDGAVVAFNVTANDTGAGSVTPVCSLPSGWTFPIGTTTVNCSAANSAGTATASFTVTVLRSFASFQDQYGLLNPDPTVDPNHIGISQLAAYAFGVNPSAPTRLQLPSAGCQNGYLQITYPRWKDAGDLTYVVEVSSDLKYWYSGAGYTQSVSVTGIDATREQVIERDLIPTSSASRRFIRVKIMH